MNETLQFIGGGAFFATLGILSLWLKGMTKGTLSLILGFLLTTALVATLFGVKYIFINGLFFGLASMVYAGFVLMYRLNKECSNLLKIRNQRDEELPAESSSKHLEDTDKNIKEMQEILNKEQK